MITTTKPQRAALARVHARQRQHEREAQPDAPEETLTPYRAFRRTVQPGPGCIMVPFAGMWLGIEPDGDTHS